MDGITRNGKLVFTQDNIQLVVLHISQALGKGGLNAFPSRMIPSKASHPYGHIALTHYQMTNYRLVQIENNLQTTF